LTAPANLTQCRPMYDKGMRRAVRTRAAVLALCGLVLLPPAAAAPARGDHA